MYIFSRSTAIDRHRPAEAIGKAAEIAGMVTQITGTDVSLFVARYGVPTNSIMWSTRAESQAELETRFEKLAGDSSYMEWVATNSEWFEDAASDRLASVVSSTLDPATKRFYTVLTAEIAQGKMTEAIGFGVRAQQFVADATGFATAFTTSVYGPFGEVAWLTGADSMAELDAVAEMQASNADFHALVTEAGPLFNARSGQTVLIEKVN